MATLEYWIQIENRPWDVCPFNKDRMTGQTLKQKEGNAPVDVVLTSTRHVTMYKPLRTTDGSVTDALILRRYQPESPLGQIGILPWTLADDRKVNPWDLNEPDPSSNGTVGTIPGPVIECNVGDKVIVHFSNMDNREDPKTKKKLPVKARTHSLHPHGFAFAATSDGAYPLSPPDKSQPVGSENLSWNAVGVKDFKMGDRVPPGATFMYTWIAGAPSVNSPNTIEPWPTTAGVWLYHDHSICDMQSVNLGAIGIIVIHNPSDPQEVDIRKPNTPMDLDPVWLPGGSATGSVIFQSGLSPVDALGEYHPPPGKALYLQLFHTLTGSNGGMLINGRQYLGNTPTLIAGPGTLMRFGVVGMGNDFHTFHIHGHRWAIPGPDGANPDTIQNSAQIRAVTQFEDTRVFGPASSFFFTIKEGSFMGARADDPTGEFHSHCHVLGHMDTGMMGSLLILPASGGFAFPLPEGEICPMDMSGGGMPGMSMIAVGKNNANTFDPPSIGVSSGTEITFDFQGSPHTVMTVSHTNSDAITITKDAGGDPTQFSQAVPAGKQKKVTIKGTSGGQIKYQCGIHGASMSGTIKIV